MAKSFTKSTPNFEAAAKGSFISALLMFKNLHTRISSLEAKFNVGSANSRTPATSLPVQAGLSVQAPVSGQISVAITNPEYIVTGPSKIKGNPLRSPIIHQIQYSPNPNFIGSVTTLPPSTQNHYLLPTGGKAQYVRMKSSFDGVHYNTAQTSGAVGD